jgi:hypothetical protein
MRYKVIAIHAEYTGNKLQLLAVLWQSNNLGWVRACYSTTNPIQGYNFLNADEQISDDLIDRVAGSGMNLPDKLKKKYFPAKKLWEH